MKDMDNLSTEDKMHIEANKDYFDRLTLCHYANDDFTVKELMDMSDCMRSNSKKGKALRTVLKIRYTVPIIVWVLFIILSAFKVL